MLGVTRGTTYRFTVQARNAYGLSLESDEIAILAAQKPDIPNNLVSTVNTNSTVTFTWSLPSNGGSPVSSYRIFIREQDET